jgi:serine/threonine protein phosphatase PrpC/predicted Ser/Thr protein kinase/ribosomal protein L39E
MSSLKLALTIGQHSDKGRKESNQDFHGALLPEEPQRSSKGIAVALADGISSSEVGHLAAQFAVHSFLDDYYSTSEAWSVKTSALKTLAATNAWLYSQTQQGQGRYDKDRGHVCTFSGIVFKSTTAHLFHIGDARITLLRGGHAEPLTQEHRVVVSEEKSYLSRAFGIHPQLDIDYRTVALEVGDVFVIATDGVHEYVESKLVFDTLAEHADNLDAAAAALAAAAFDRGSIDNLTVQLVRIDGLPSGELGELQQQLAELPLPPLLNVGAEFDGYRILRELHGSSRSHVYLAHDRDTDEQVVIKIPSVDLSEDAGHLEAYLMEEWIARRIDHPHVLKAGGQTRKKHFLYVVTEYIEGCTLTQWMRDHPQPNLETVRNLIDQIAKGLQAFHRLEMLHQDLRPDNILIDTAGTVKLIDFGSASVAGVDEATRQAERSTMLGTPQYTAPEYFLWEEGTTRSDQFSLGVIAYQLLTDRLPYGAEVAKCKTAAEHKKLKYASLLQSRRDVPAWVDGAIKKAVHPNPERRYEAISEFLYDLRHPNRVFMTDRAPPIIDRDPVRFWQGVSLLLFVLLVASQGAHILK